MWLGILKILLSLSNAVMRWAGDKQLLDAGESRAVAENLQKSMDAIDKARRVRRDVKYLGGVPDGDPNDRDTLRGD